MVISWSSESLFNNYFPLLLSPPPLPIHLPFPPSFPLIKSYTASGFAYYNHSKIVFE